MKRVFDLLAALIALVILLPLSILIIILIKVEGTGQVFFTQKRVGQYGKLFTIVKFRTMYSNHKGNSISIKGESRVTPLGKILRKFKLDEIPEFWNVIKGDMSIVGPRPDVLGYADKLMAENKKILQLKPGITGPASLKYANEEKILSLVSEPIKYNDEFIYPDKVQTNLEYYYNHSFWGDIKIIWKTIFRTNY